MKRLRSWARRLPAPIPLACYALAFVFWLGGGLALLGWEAAGRAGGRLAETALDPAALEQADIAPDATGGWVTTGGDPQLIWRNPDGRMVRTLLMEVAFSQTPREVCLYYTTRADEPFSSGKRVFGEKMDDGNYRFQLPAGSIAALRLDPCSPAEEQGAITLTGLALTLNVDAPWYAAFAPGWSGLFAWLVWPGLAAAAVRWVWDGWRWLRGRKHNR